jgi:hypothetical protein
MYRQCKAVSTPGVAKPYLWSHNFGPAGRREMIKEKPIKIDGRVMTADEFAAFVETKRFGWRPPNRIFLHHTWQPTREQWKGKQTLLAIKNNYEGYTWTDSQGRVHIGWTAGPHLFVADDGIWLFTDLARDGVGVKGHNHRSLHLEMVGNYDQRLPDGPTLANTVAALGALHNRLGLDPKDLLFHRDYSYKSCPGNMVTKEWIIPKIEDWIAHYREQDDLPPSEAIEETPPIDQMSLEEFVHSLADQRMAPVNPEAAIHKKAIELGLLGPITDEIHLEADGQAYIVQLFMDALVVPIGQWDQVKRLNDVKSES